MDIFVKDKIKIRDNQGTRLNYLIIYSFLNSRTEIKRCLLPKNSERDFNYGSFYLVSF